MDNRYNFKSFLVKFRLHTDVTGQSCKPVLACFSSANNCVAIRGLLPYLIHHRSVNTTYGEGLLLVVA